MPLETKDTTGIIKAYIDQKLNYGMKLSDVILLFNEPVLPHEIKDIANAKVHAQIILSKYLILINNSTDDALLV